MWRAERTKTHFGFHPTEWSIFDGLKRVARVQGAGGSAEENAKLIVRLKAENEQLRRDLKIVLANLEWIEEVSGDSLEGEDAAMVAAIKANPGDTSETLST